MGEIAEDCYDRAMEELDFGYLDYDPHYPCYPTFPTRRRAAPKTATVDDFEDLSAAPKDPDDLSDLI
jgi:hypothetical protein